jgi:hypothetical protein
VTSWDVLLSVFCGAMGGMGVVLIQGIIKELKRIRKEHK